MKNPRGKKITRIETEDEVIDIYENKHLRWMQFDDDVIQTLIYKDKPHQLILEHLPIMLSVFKFILKPEKVLLVGLGGGAFVHYIHYYHPECYLTSVEINEEVIQLAKHYFYLPENQSTLSIVHDDIETYLKQDHQSYDVIFMDMYAKHKMPACYTQQNFFGKAYEHLHKIGIMVVNLLCPRTDEFLLILNKIKSVFNNQTICIPVKGYSNVIVFAFKSNIEFKNILQFGDESTLKKLQFDTRFGLCAQDN